MLALKGAVITPQEIIKDGVVVVDGSKIAYVGNRHACSLRGRLKVIDCRGKFTPHPNCKQINVGAGFICPGFIDVHAQGAGGCDILDGAYNTINTISKTLAKNGTTAFLATTIFRVQGSGFRVQPHLEAVAEAMKKGTDGAQVLGIHLEGPFINPKKCGMIKKENILMAVGTGLTGNSCRARPVPNIASIIDVCCGSLKMMTIAPELPGAIDIIKKLKKNKIVASIGHTDATYEEAVKGFDAGITHATHVFNAMRGLHHRQPGAVGAVLTDKRVSAQLIADGKHLHPAVVELVVKQKGTKNTVLITDSMSAAGLPDGKYVYNGLKYESKGGLAVYCAGRGRSRPSPTIIGTALTLNKIVKRIVDMGAADLQQAVEMASLSAARALGIENKKGSLEAGKDADIIVMDKNCDVETTIINGNICWSLSDQHKELKK